jgi:hypothetical protein
VVCWAGWLDTYESGRVVVTGGFSITIGFQHGVSLHDLVFQRALIPTVGKERKKQDRNTITRKYEGDDNKRMDPCCLSAERC